MTFSLPEKRSTPFNDLQYQQFHQLLTQLTSQQLAWAAGFLSGLGAESRAGRAMPATASQGGDITILVGSQTGNCEKLAQRACDVATAKGLSAVVRMMGDYKLPQLKTEKNLLVIVSTHGEGEPPDNAKDMHEFIFSKRAPSLKHASFSVLGLGDSSYEFFCKMGVDFDRRLEELGAKRIHPRVDCDVDYDDSAEKWIDGVLSQLATSMAASPETVAVMPTSGTGGTDASRYGRKNPFPSTLLADIILNGRGSDKETHHLELSLEGSGLSYEPGDSLGVYPLNAPDVVDALLAALKFKGDEPVAVGEVQSSLHDAFLRHLEITTITRPAIKAYAELVKSSRLGLLVDDQHKKELADYLYGRELVDLVTEFPASKISPQDFVNCLRKLPPRLYSIASSLKQHPDEVHLTVAAVRYHANGRDRKGVCSTYFADRIGEDSTIAVYVDTNSNFKLPASPDTPVIMIGPGTGIAPFRAFMEEREATGASGQSWLFFGDQHFMQDFLYQAEWLRYLKQGVLSRMDVAFSRDQDHKVYVQHRMQEHSRDLYSWLQDGAHLYVCGDEKRMAHDVHQALLDLVGKEGGMSGDQAEEYVRQLQRSKRYQRDVY